MMLGLNEAIGQLAMANSEQKHEFVSTREGGHVLRSVLEY